MNLQELQSEARLRALDARCLARLAESDSFNLAWSYASETERIEIAQHFVLCDRFKAEAWSKKILKQDLAQKSVRELREIAKGRGFDYYSHKSKAELLRELKQ